MTQYAIVKQKTKAQSCENYASNITSGDTSLYFYFGNPVSWATVPGGSNNDTNPPIPKDTLFEEKRTWDGIIGLKKITGSDIKRAFRRVNWTSSQYYDMYRDDYDGSTVTGVSLAGEFTNTKPASLSRSNNVVLVNDGGVYKLYRCIDNRSSATGNPIASTTKPTFTTTNIATLADGYKWKYLGELSSTDVNDFLTTTHCPLPTVIGAAAAAGHITSIVLTNRGSGYTSTPTVTVTGDGTGLTLGTPVVSSGAIVYIPVTNVGTGYSYVNVTITGGGTPTSAATAKAIIAPKGGFAFDLTQELEPNFLVVKADNINTDNYFPTRGNAFTAYTSSSGTGIPNLTYRVVGLLENPTNYGTTTRATSTLLTNFTEYRYNETLGSLVYGDRYTTAVSGLANPVTTVVSVRQDSSNVVRTITFNAASNVNGTSNQLTSVAHNLITGDAVLYNNNGGTSVGGLTHNTTYYVIKIGVDTIQLAISLANAQTGLFIPITPGIGSGQTLTQTNIERYVGLIRTTEQLIQNNPITTGTLFTKTDSSASFYIGPFVTFNGSSSAVVGIGSDIITIPNHPFKTGDSVVYTNGGGTTIASTGSVLVTGNTYFVIRTTTNELKLATSLTNANAGVSIDFTSVGSGTAHTLTFTGTGASYNPTVEKYSGKIVFTEYRNSLTRTTTKEKYRFVLEF